MVMCGGCLDGKGKDGKGKGKGADKGKGKGKSKGKRKEQREEQGQGQVKSRGKRWQRRWARHRAWREDQKKKRRVFTPAENLLLRSMAGAKEQDWVHIATFRKLREDRMDMLGSAVHSAINVLRDDLNTVMPHQGEGGGLKGAAELRGQQRARISGSHRGVGAATPVGLE